MLISILMVAVLGSVWLACIGCSRSRDSGSPGQLCNPCIRSMLPRALKTKESTPKVSLWYSQTVPLKKTIPKGTLRRSETAKKARRGAYSRHFGDPVLVKAQVPFWVHLVR